MFEENVNLEGCDNCTKRSICRYYEKFFKSHTYIGPGWGFRTELDELIRELLPKHCMNFEKERQWQGRDIKGRLIGRKPLKLWYPNQEPKEQAMYSWGRTPSDPCCRLSPFCRCNVERYREKYGYNK